MITLTNNETGTEIGEISDDAFAFLAGQLEEESTEDSDYYIMSVTVDAMESAGADAGLVRLLRAAIGEAEGVEIRWRRA